MDILATRFILGKFKKPTQCNAKARAIPLWETNTLLLYDRRTDIDPKGFVLFSFFLISVNLLLSL